MGNVLGTALAGLNQAAQGIQTVASNVANVNTPDYRTVRASRGSGTVEYQNDPAESTSADTDNGTSDVDLATETIELKRHEQAYRANATLVQLESERIGTVLDIIA